MNTKINEPFNEPDDGKYIIIKVPRKTIQENDGNPLGLFIEQQKYNRTFRIIGFIIVFLVGIIIGSIYHDHILTVNSNHATWKIFTTASKAY